MLFLSPQHFPLSVLTGHLICSRFPMSLRYLTSKIMISKILNLFYTYHLLYEYFSNVIQEILYDFFLLMSLGQDLQISMSFLHKHKMNILIYRYRTSRADCKAALQDLPSPIICDIQLSLSSVLKGQFYLSSFCFQLENTYIKK